MGYVMLNTTALALETSESRPTRAGGRAVRTISLLPEA
jgi:hypothetical protein